MSKKALLVLADGFEETEAIVVADILRRAEVDLTIAALDNLQVTGSRKIKVSADKRLGEIKEKMDALILPGGSRGAENLARSQEVKEWIEKVNREGGIIAAICAAPAVVLAPTGILEGKKATGYPGSEKEFSRQTTFLEKDVVIDGNLITSRGVGTVFAFALALVERLCDKNTLEKVKQHALLK
jgi:4-methyl-5(b-hydroxyethyl)-thiazole monophosphate biosynthesis